MRRFRRNIVHIRLFKMLYISSFVFILLVGRLYWIQVKNHNLLKVQALKQRGKEISLYPNRGIIYDKNLIPLQIGKKLILCLFLKIH